MHADPSGESGLRLSLRRRSMFGSEVLEIGIGVIFLFLFVSLIATALREGIEAWFKTRAADLERGIVELLNDPNTVQKFYSHPLISSLYGGQYESSKKEGR